MPWDDDPAMHALRMTYNAAVTAHAGWSRALTEAMMRGEHPSEALIESEAKARANLNNARKKLHGAMALAIGGSVPTC